MPSDRPTSQPGCPTFDEFAFPHIDIMRPKWRNPKHAEQWVATVRHYASPVIGQTQLADIDTPQILKILEPMWQTKPETASRLRGRLEKILSAAATRQYRQGINPAMWKGHLENLLPSQRRSNAHHAALPYKNLPAFMERLETVEGISALALRFTILTASRTGEVIGALRSEITEDVWTVPAERMKAGREHQVPLCGTALELIATAECLDPDSQYLFSNNGKPLSGMAMLMMVRRMTPGVTVHGFRSTFRDWVSEETDHSPEVAEMALAHTIANKVEAAYRRGRLLERRRQLMRDWESYCTQSRSENAAGLRNSDPNQGEATNESTTR
jgi:integrase